MEHNVGRILYLDAAAGISGDMFLGAAVDIAKKLDDTFELDNLMKRIAVEGYVISLAQGRRAGISGLKVDVHTHEHHPHRHLSDIRDILQRSRISETVREKAIAAFSLLADTEAKVHGTTRESIHFHEVGAVDAIVDIVGALLLMEHLGWPRVFSSSVNVGSGTVSCAHGVLPVPAPATADLLVGFPIYAAGEPMERTTPTGALLLRVLVGAEGFCSLPPSRILCTGTGLGGRDTPRLPNVLRATLLDPLPAASVGSCAISGRFQQDAPVLMETNIDDMNPQDFALVMERLLYEGALDVWCEHILMKKARQGIKLCCLCRAEDAESLAEMIMRDTTTLGVRIARTERLMLARQMETVETSFGSVRVKIASLDGQTLRRVPEYDDILRIAREKNLPISELRRAIVKEID